jgi:hypothetical protein
VLIAYLVAASSIWGGVMVFTATTVLEFAKERKRYIANGQNILLVLCKQFNEFSNIKLNFVNTGHRDKRKLLVSDTTWRLSKEETLGLNDQKDPKEMLQIQYDLALLMSNYNQLLDWIHDHANAKDPKGADEAQCKIQDIIRGMDFNGPVDRLYNYLKKRFPNDTFPKPEVTAHSNG